MAKTGPAKQPNNTPLLTIWIVNFMIGYSRKTYFVILSAFTGKRHWRLRNLACCFCVLVVFSMLNTAANARQLTDTLPGKFQFNTIVIDPGHGGKDAGAHGDFSMEKNVALSIGKKLKAALNTAMPNVKVIMTRDDDTFIELNRRAEIANEHHANLFISIHCNSSPEGTAKVAHKQVGALVLLYGYHRKGEQEEAVRENASIYQERNYQEHYEQPDDPTQMILLKAYMQKYRLQSIRFADLLISEFRDHDHRQIIGIKEQGVLVLAHSGMPAVLIETGFINNPEEEKYLNSDAGQDEIVQSIVRAIQQYRDEIMHT